MSTSGDLLGLPRRLGLSVKTQLPSSPQGLELIPLLIRINHSHEWTRSGGDLERLLSGLREL